MREIKFLSYEVNDFQGIDSFSFNFNDKTTTIFGTNKAGKSSLIDSLLWTVTGKNALNQADTNFDIIPVDKAGRVIPDAEPRTKLTMIVDGIIKTIERKLSLKVQRSIDGEIDFSRRFKAERTFSIDGMKIENQTLYFKNSMIIRFLYNLQ